MWNNQKISVVFPTYTEKDFVRPFIERFLQTGVVDEIIVCNNNALAGTSEEIAKTMAKEVFENRQGYGWACRKALASAKGDLIILCEPDGTFEPFDIFKLLAYSNDFEVVFGSRTNSLMVWKGANMGFAIKWANWLVAKYMEFLFNTACLTDVGCTMRLIKRQALEKIKPRFKVGGSHFGVEMMLLCIINKFRFIEVPLNYKRRMSRGTLTESYFRAAKIASNMIILITIFRIRSWLGLDY
jgi:glycosyltransferase involved in cell wall biosynthesis